jgi:DNA (cytosine-5)-methyltransferase 1
MNVIDKTVDPSPISLLPRKSFAEFFAGIGLMHMGLEHEDWFADFANDIDEKKKERYCGHFEEDWVTFSDKDLHKLSPDLVSSVTLATDK